LHRRQAQRLGPRPALRYKRHGLYHEVSWHDYHEQALACAAALAEAGVAPGDRVGLLAENRAEWLIADMGILAAAAVNVPPHAPLTARQVHFQLADAGVRWLFVSTREQLDKVRQIRAELPLLESVVVFDRAAAGQDATSWAGFLQCGRRALGRVRDELARRERALGPDDLATIMYTSGTTGNPKGVMLTHDNLLSNSVAVEQASRRGPETIVLNWLPFSHIYARTVDHYVAIVTSALLCLAESAETVVQNLKDIQPTHISCVPRFYEKLLAAVGGSNPEETGKRLKAIFGPRMYWLGSGGAPLPLPVADAYREAGLLVLQGYGLTESAPVISFNCHDAYKLETVGRVIPGVEVKIAPDGEILTRGPHVMKGYWKNPSATAETLRDGWLHTGDLGRLDADGYLTITGRKKDLLVLSNGKKVVPTEIEGLLVADDCIDQAVVYGEGKNYLTALIVPHFANLQVAVGAEAIHHEDTGQLIQDPAAVAFMARRIDNALADAAAWEKVQKFLLLPRAFTQDAEELTVSLKVRRGVIIEKYRRQLEGLYAE
jgi:long-chain acyl-CoA synthetase